MSSFLVKYFQAVAIYRWAGLKGWAHGGIEHPSPDLYRDSTIELMRH